MARLRLQWQLLSLLGLVFLVPAASALFPAQESPVFDRSWGSDGFYFQGGDDPANSPTAHVREDGAQVTTSAEAPERPMTQAVAAADGWTPAEAVATGVAVGGAVAGFALWKLALVLYSRLARDRVLDAPLRARIMEALEANPGRSVAELIALCGTTENNIRYHLGVLRRHGLVRAVRVQGDDRFLVMAHDARVVRRAEAVRSNPRLAALAGLAPRAPVPAHELARLLQARLGIARSSAWHLLRQAEAAGLLARESAGGRILLRSDVGLDVA